MNRQELEEKVQNAMMIFTDFLYVIVFGLILQKIYEDVLDNPFGGIGHPERLLLLVGIFYFLAWDWIHGRLLTLKNPYKGYWRFFIELLIAACGFGAAHEAVEGRTSFLFYILLILGLGTWWAKITLREHPSSADERELTFIQEYQQKIIVLLIFFFIPVIFQAQVITNWLHSLFIIVYGILFVFFYELEVERDQGVLGGPGVPFISRQTMRRIRRHLGRG